MQLLRTTAHNSGDSGQLAWQDPVLYAGPLSAAGKQCTVLI
jgi:hypothetical protein